MDAPTFDYIEVIEGPDGLGRYRYLAWWYVERPPSCLTCGADETRGCACYDRWHYRCQVYRAPLPQPLPPAWPPWPALPTAWPGW